MERLWVEDVAPLLLLHVPNPLQLGDHAEDPWGRWEPLDQVPCYFCERLLLIYGMIKRSATALLPSREKSTLKYC